jgi:hypothetical protein
LLRIRLDWKAAQQGGSIVMGQSWGFCRDCKWWQIEPDASLNNLTMGLCIDEDLQRFVLRVSGASGCNRFMDGKPARARGSSAAPPEARPTR